MATEYVTALTASTEQALWDEVAAGGTAAFELLFDRHIDAVYQHCFRLTGSWSGAEEGAQATFVLAWRKRDQVRVVSGSGLPWLLTVATNEVRNQQRSLRRWVGAIQRGRGEEVVADHADEVAQRLDDAQQMQALLAMVKRLPRAEQEALALCVWSRLSYADAAAVLNVAEGSVRSRVSRAKARLAAQTGMLEVEGTR